MSKKNLFFCLIFLVVGLFLGYFLRPLNDNRDMMASILGNKEYPFINQFLDKEPMQETTQGELLALKSHLTQYINEQTDKGNIIKASVYYRDLNNGPWIGVNEKDDFSPASLLKVPILMAVLKYSEQNPSFLIKKVVYHPINDGVVQDIKPTHSLVGGQKYSIEELLRRMIIESDNEAKNLILLQIKRQDLDIIYNDLGIEIPGIKMQEDYMSVRTYATFFRILYSASYLNKELSNRALEMLSKSEYTKGLVAGLPSAVKIAHKFGERQIDGGIKQLHDCGIVYNGKKPYILCVMTRGYDWDVLSQTIKDISQITYSKVKGE